MSTKALRKELLAAIAMVIVAAIALSGSTYAWFAVNNTVTAENLQVNAAVEGGIEIAHALKTEANVDHQTVTSSALAIATLYPTSTSDAETWYHASAELASKFDAKVDTYTTAAVKADNATTAGIGYQKKIEATSDHAIFLIDTFNIRSTAEEALAEGLWVKEIEVTSGPAVNNTSMSAAMRVGIKLADPAVATGMAIYAPLRTSGLTYNVYNGSTTDTAITALKADEEALITKTETTQVPAKDGTNNGGFDVEVYVWFEGEDAALFSDNFNSEDIVISVSFRSDVD